MSECLINVPQLNIQTCWIARRAQKANFDTRIILQFSQNQRLNAATSSMLSYFRCQYLKVLIKRALHQSNIIDLGANFVHAISGRSYQHLIFAWNTATTNSQINALITPDSNKEVID
jgi:hypothetical protein